MARAFDVNGYMDAWRRKDLDRILGYHAEDATMEDPLMGPVAQGKEYLRRHMGAEMPLMDELTLEPRLVTREGPRTAALVHLGVRYGGDLRRPSGETVPLAGRSLSLDMGVFLESDEEGRITRETWVFDLAKAMRQLGVSEETMARSLRESPFADLASRGR